VGRRLEPTKVEELIQGYVEGLPVDVLAQKFRLIRAPFRSTPADTAYPVEHHD